MHLDSKDTSLGRGDRLFDDAFCLATQVWLLLPFLQRTWRLIGMLRLVAEAWYMFNMFSCCLFLFVLGGGETIQFWPTKNAKECKMHLCCFSQLWAPMAAFSLFHLVWLCSIRASLH